MNRRLTKELRPLLLPGFIAAIAAFTPLLLSTFRSGGTDEFLSFLRGLAFFAFVGMVALLACVPFGLEIRERTFPLLMSQPIRRSRMWIEKFLAALVMVVVLGLLQFWISRQDGLFSGWQVAVLTAPLSSQEELLMGAFLLITICAAGFWTLVARSTIGGMAFTLASQLLLMLGLGFVFERMGYLNVFERIHETILNVDSPVPAFLVAGAIYAGVLLWAGWRKFANLELRDSSLGEAVVGQASSAQSRRWSSLLRCRPTGCITNLVRKELRLQKPVLVIAGLVSLCWLATLGLCVLAPVRKEFFEETCNVLTGVFMVLVPLLAGCISLGEEKTLGLNEWQLTLPASSRRQWFVKLAVAAVVAIGLGLMCPVLLAWVSSSTMDTGLAQGLRDSHRQEALMASLTMVGVPFLLSFWAATLTANTVRSALIGIAGFVILFSSTALGVWCASKAGGMEAPLLKFVLAHFQLSGESAQRPLSEVVAIAAYACIILGIVIVLAQSLAQFRRVRSQTRTAICYAATVAGFTFLAAFWVVDIQMSNAKASSQLQTDIADALKSLPDAPPDPGRFQAVRIADLERTGRLSGAAKTWLRGASITIQRIEVKTSSSQPAYQKSTGQVNNWRLACVRFPKGRQEFIGPYQVMY